MTMTRALDAQKLLRERPQLLAIAYRMLGSRADAEDVVQEAFTRLQRVDADSIEAPHSFLRSVVTRLCIDQLRSARARREVSAVELPEPLDSAALDGAQIGDLADSLSVAFLVLLQSLSPTERAVFLLREIFELDYDEIAAVVEKSATNCRQIASRAKRTLRQRRGRGDAPSAEQAHQLIGQFVEALRRGDQSALLELLAPDVVLHADGGDKRPAYGRARALRRPLAGAPHVAQFLDAIMRQAPDTRVQLRSINAEPALCATVDGELVAVISFALDSARVHAIFVNADPDKLARLS